MIGQLAHFVAEQRAVYVAEARLDVAERKLINATQPDKRSAARTHYRAALIELDVALARLEKKKHDLAGSRHLRVVCCHLTTTNNNEGTPNG